MKRFIALGFVCLLVLGLGALAWAADPAPVEKVVELEIGDACEFDDNAGWSGWADAQGAAPVPGIGDPALSGTFYNKDTVTGRSNHKCCIKVTIDGPFTSYSSHSGVTGKTLPTSFALYQPSGAATPIYTNANVTGPDFHVLTFPHNPTDGSFSFDIEVDVTRNGWADHEGSYDVLITYECVDC